jgi:hypothetical protein
MRIDLREIKGTCIAEIISEKIEISDVQDALDIMADCGNKGARNIIINKKNITPDFFDLKKGIAGQILQKFSTYDVKLSIVGDFSGYTSKSLRDFIYESNIAGRISFVNSVNEALQKLIHFF